MITIIGAGPIGNYLGYLLAKAGKKVQIFEMKKEIGKPVQCTGIVTREIEKLIKLDKEFVVNNVKKVRVVGPSGKNIILDIDDVIIDRTKFDQHIADMARNAGAVIYLNHRLIGVDKKNKEIILLNKNKKKKIKYDILVGADGPNSLVAKIIGVQHKYWTGMQIVGKINTIKKRNTFEINKECYEVYVGEAYPGFFGWMVPENEKIARIGIASEVCETTDKNPKKIFEKFRQKFDCETIEMQGGLIPIHNPEQKIREKDIYLVGDAAGQVKATTGGGIVPGMKAAKCLAREIIKPSGIRKDKENEREDNENKKNLKKLKRELWVHLMIRKTLNKFKDEDYEKLIKCLDNKRIKKILKEENRDKPIKLVIKALIAEPRLMSFLIIFFRKTPKDI